MPYKIWGASGAGIEEENYKTCTQPETTSCSFCFCDSASSLHSHVSYIVSGRQILATMLGAETHSPLSITQTLQSCLIMFVCVKVRHLPRCVLTAVPKFRRPQVWISLWTVSAAHWSLEPCTVYKNSVTSLSGLRAGRVNSSGPASAVNLSSPALWVWCLVSWGTGFCNTGICPHPSWLLLFPEVLGL